MYSEMSAALQRRQKQDVSLNASESQGRITRPPSYYKRLALEA
jgi:hypothetical protein